MGPGGSAELPSFHLVKSQFTSRGELPLRGGVVVSAVVAAAAVPPAAATAAAWDEASCQDDRTWL
jgi:hypothetical protein